jgi:translocator protein
MSRRKSRRNAREGHRPAGGATRAAADPKVGPFTVRSPRALGFVALLVLVLALLGTLATGGGWNSWYEGLDKPSWLLPLPVFFVVAALYYALAVFLLYRINTRAQGNSRRTRWWLLILTVVMLAANEAWNYLFLARESVDAGFLGMVIFAGIVVALWLALIRARRRVEALALLPYVAWVAYDLAWTFEVWRLNG